MSTDTKLTEEEVLERSKKAYAKGAWNQLDPVVSDEDRKIKIARTAVKQASTRNEKCVSIRSQVLGALRPEQAAQ